MKRRAGLHPDQQHELQPAQGARSGFVVPITGRVSTSATVKIAVVGKDWTPPVSPTVHRRCAPRSPSMAA